MKIIATETFLKSLDELDSFYNKFISTPWYNFKHGIKNIWNFKKIVWEHRDWDYEYILRMQYFQLERLKNLIDKYGNEVDESRIPKVKDMERCIELIKNIIDDEYYTRVGCANQNYKFELNEDDTLSLISSYTDEEFREFYEKTIELKEKEIEELYKILKEKSESWWD